MSDYLSRIKKEKKELVDKLQKLEDFVYSDDFAKLPDESKELLFRQRTAMTDYRDVLAERIEFADT